MSEPTKIEYRIKPVTRYIVTRYEESDAGCSVRDFGDYSRTDDAHNIAYSLCSVEHKMLGWPVDDGRIQYPKQGLLVTDEVEALEIAERTILDQTSAA